MEQYCYEYPRPALTSDCIILDKTNDEYFVLLIRRAHDPFKGKWAFPGGFVDMDETTTEAAKRELFEETGILLDNLVQLQTFSEIDRDPRGRTVSVVYYSIIEKRPEVKAGDDASQAHWFPLNDLPELAFDHSKIMEFTRKTLNI